MLSRDISVYHDREEDTELCALYQGLLSVLRREAEVYRELKTVIAREKDILMKPSLGDIQASNSRKETCILKAKVLEEARMNGVKRIAKRLGIQDPVNLTLLASHADDALREELKACQADLTLLAGEIGALNKVNRDLLDSSLTFLRGSIDFIHALLSPGSTYMNTGKVALLPRNGKILQTEG